MKKQRRQFDKEFKLMAVELCRSGKSTCKVAEELGLRPELVNRWKREYEQRKAGSFSGNGKQVQTELEAENARLKKQLKDSELENAILKKAVSIFSRNDGKYFNS
jgi:transposase